MASIRFPEGQQRSGSSGGLVFSHNRYGPYIRARSIPVNPQSPRQDDIRTYLRNLAIQWNQTLTQPEREAWMAYANNVPWTNKFGDACALTGQNMFIRTNSIRLMLGVAVLKAAPIIFELAEGPMTFACTASTATQLLSVVFGAGEDWAKEVGGFLGVWMGQPRNGARNFFNGPWRFCMSVAGLVVPPTSPKTGAVAFPVALGNRVTCYASCMRADGRLSEVARNDFFCAA